jgi:UV DNA damage endonuclease
VRRTKKVIAAEVAEAARQGKFDELTSLTGTYSHVALYNNNSNHSTWQQLLSESAAAAAAAGNSVTEGTGDITKGLVDSKATALAVAAAAARKGQHLEEVAAAGPVVVKYEEQQQQDGSSSSSSRGVLCRVSGLGNFRQQVWLHNVTHDSAALLQPTQSYEDWKEEEMQRQDAEEAAAAAAAAQAAAEGEDGEADEQQQQQSKKKQKKQTPRKFTRSSSTTPYGQGVLSSQPSASALITDSQVLALDPTAAAAATAEGTAPASSSLVSPDTAAAAAAAAATSPEVRLLPNLGYACLCMTMRQFDMFNSRDCVKKTRDAPDGLAKVSQLALANARDLLPMILWNEAHGIRLFRLSSCILPWMTSYEPEELPDWTDIKQALREAGDAAKRLGHRLTFHPSEYCKIAGERPDWVTQSVRELEVHSRIFDEMGFLPASPHNKINIHVGGTYGGEKEPVLRRFAAVINDRLSPNCKARMTVENDDRANMYSVKDLMLVHELSGIPIVFDFHHWKFCTGGQTQEEAFRLALTTWPEGVRPLVHWSESPEDPDKMRSAHSDYIDGPINLFGLEGEVDVMIESKAKELALLEYRQAVIEGWTIRPKQRNAELAAAAAIVKAEVAAAKAEAKAEAKAAKAAEKGEMVEAGATPAAGRAVRRSTSRSSRRRKKSKESESEEDEDVELTDVEDE